jgi:Na+/proline symporter
VIASAFVVTFYTYIGGMWAISITDFIQSIIIVLGLVVVAVILANQAGGVSNVLKEVQPDTFRFFPNISPSRYSSLVGSMVGIGVGFYSLARCLSTGDVIRL